MAIQKSEVQVEKQSESQEGGIQRIPSQIVRDPFRLLRELARSPFGVMRELMDPFREIAPLDFGPRGWSPDFDVRETKDSYVFKVDLPGTKKEDIDISLVGNRLQVSGKREEEEETRDDTFYTYERTCGSFTRSFTLPDTADTEHISSNLDEGVLTLVIPKTAESKARKIQIGSGAKH